jgi:hypothetical protein
MTKGFDYQLTNKAKTLIALSQLLQSDTDCVRHLYKVLQDAEEEENKEYHTNRLLRLLFQKDLGPRWTMNSFPVDRNIAQWGIKINRVEERTNHLDMIQMIGGSSKECGSPYYRFIMNIKQQDWINGNLLMESNGATILVKEEPPPPSLKDKVKTLDYKVAVDGTDGTDESLYEVFGTYGSLSMRASELSINPLRISRFLGAVLVVEVETIRYHSTEHHYGRYM